MDRCYFIDKKTFEVYQEHPNVFSCDPLIAETVSILNKKGYQTRASCESHYEIKEYDPSYSKEKMITQIYIFFEQEYKFSSLPEEFKTELIEGKTSIFHTIYYYHENGKHKHRREFEIEKEKYINKLNEWAKKLPERER